MFKTEHVIFFVYMLIAVIVLDLTENCESLVCRFGPTIAVGIFYISAMLFYKNGGRLTIKSLPSILLFGTLLGVLLAAIGLLSSQVKTIILCILLVAVFIQWIVEKSRNRAAEE